MRKLEETEFFCRKEAQMPQKIKYEQRRCIFRIASQGVVVLQSLKVLRFLRLFVAIEIHLVTVSRL